MQTKLSNSEWRIMNLLWEGAPRTITEITKALLDETNWSKHEIMTYLKRMEAKGAVYFEQGERAKLYYPNIEKSETVLDETKDFLNRVFDGKLSLLISTMVDKNGITDDDIEELKRILREDTK